MSSNSMQAKVLLLVKLLRLESKLPTTSLNTTLWLAHGVLLSLSILEISLKGYHPSLIQPLLRLEQPSIGLCIQQQLIRDTLQLLTTFLRWMIAGMDHSKIHSKLLILSLLTQLQVSHQALFADSEWEFRITLATVTTLMSWLFNSLSSQLHLLCQPSWADQVETLQLEWLLISRLLGKNLKTTVVYLY